MTREVAWDNSPSAPVRSVVRVDRGAVHGCRLSDLAGFGRGRQHGVPGATPGPPVEPIVDHGGRTVFRRHVAPTPTRARHVQTPEHHSAVVYPPRPELVRGHEPPHHGPLLVR